MSRLLAVALVLVLLGSAAPVTGTASQEDTSVNPTTLTSAGEFDGAEFQITVYEDGSARWTFEYARTLSNESERQQFTSFAERFNNNTTQLYSDFKGQATSLVESGAKATDRPMKATNFSRQASVEGINDNVGVVQMSFTWTWFAVAENGSVVIGDVFDDGLYLGPEQSLVVETGDGLKFTAVEPKKPAILSGQTLPTSDTVTWKGKQEFTDEHPRVMFAPQNTTTQPTTDASVGGGGANTPTTLRTTTPATGGDSPMMWLAAAVIVLLGLGAAFAWRQGSLGSLSTDGSGTDHGGAGSVASTTSRERETEREAKPAVSDEELLTDEARVKQLLTENGGRMKQVNIVEETGWSKSKVSMLLSEMEDEGDISKLRVGRENIISLDGHEPDAAGSPLDDESA